jgi:hypothetical protein
VATPNEEKENKRKWYNFMCLAVLNKETRPCSGTVVVVGV